MTGRNPVHVFSFLLYNITNKYYKKICWKIQNVDEVNYNRGLDLQAVLD